MTAMEYEIRVSGLLPASVLAELEGVTVADLPAVTVLRGPVADQSALHGILNRLLGLDLELIDVHRLAAERGPDGH